MRQLYAALDRDGLDLRGALQVQVGDGVEQQPPAAQVVIHAAQNEWAAQARLALDELAACQPMSTQNASIERLRGVVLAHRSREGEAQRRAAVARMAPQVDAEQGF